MFPTLTPAQIARIATHGVARSIARGDVLIEAGEPIVPFFVVTAGEVEIIRPSNLGDTLIAIHGAGQFTGEANMILGRRSLMRARASEPGDVIQLTREQLLGLIQTDAEISEILMRAFIYRRPELPAQAPGDAVLVASLHSAGTLPLREFLTRRRRNSAPRS